WSKLPTIATSARRRICTTISFRASTAASTPDVGLSEAEERAARPRPPREQVVDEVEDVAHVRGAVPVGVGVLERSRAAREQAVDQVEDILHGQRAVAVRVSVQRFAVALSEDVAVEEQEAAPAHDEVAIRLHGEGRFALVTGGGAVHPEF